MTSAHARSWGPQRAGAVYERGRPDFPTALATLIREQADLGPASRILDVAAGTGKLTRVLATAGLRTIAVEPMPGMRTQLRRILPAIPVLAGQAERLPIRTATIDAVTVAQAFHWFAVGEASRELRRVLTPTGTLVLINNARSPDHRISHDLWEVLGSFEHLAPRPDSTRGWRAELDRLGDFGGWRHFELINHQVLADPAALEARFTSISFVLLLEDRDRRRLIAALKEAARDDYPIRLPLRTLVDIGDRTTGRA